MVLIEHHPLFCLLAEILSFRCYTDTSRISPVGVLLGARLPIKQGHIMQGARPSGVNDKGDAVGLPG